MRTTEGRSPVTVMAFFHHDGLTAAWQQAVKFAGKGGMLATLPDIVLARLNTNPGDPPWETYYTTITAEYYGTTKQGSRVLIVAHGIGPMSTLAGIQKAYSWEYKDKSCNRRGGRITEEQFWDLEAGKFGEVSVVDLDDYCQRYEYPFIQILRASEAITDPVLKARFGELTEDYVIAHAYHAMIWHREQAGLDPENKYGLSEVDHKRFLTRRHEQHVRDGAMESDPYIIKVDGASNCCYTFGRGHGRRAIEQGYAIAHLVSTSGLCNMHHEGNESLVLDVSCHEWSDGTRFVGIQSGCSCETGIHPGPNPYKLVRTCWRDLLLSTAEQEEIGMRGLIQIGDQWFTQYPKVGDRMDTGEPEYVVTSIKKIGDPVFFRTTIGGYYGFFKFGVNEVQAIAPPEANAYFFVGEPQIESSEGNPMYHTRMVQFYRITADLTRRLMRSDQLSHDFKRMMNLIA